MKGLSRASVFLGFVGFKVQIYCIYIYAKNKVRPAPEILIAEN